jgi:hypothetical protein
MPGPGSWAERVREAVLEEARQHRGDAGLILLDACALDEHRLEFRFLPNYLDGREVILVLDGQFRFAEDFLVDGPDEAPLALEDWPVEELAWRIFLLGMQEPFSPSELSRGSEGRWLRLMTASISTS